MRSELVYAAGLQIQNRFLLASTAMLTVHKLHVKATRTEDTINWVLTELANSRKLVYLLPQIDPTPRIVAFLDTPAA